MTFARRVYTLAFIWGLLVVPPMYLLEGEYARRYGPLAHPEWWYGFAGVVLAMQFLYGLIGRDPVRYRPVMPIAIAAKLGFGLTLVVLWTQGRTPGQVVAMGLPDLVWVVFFAIAWLKTPRSP